MIVLATTTLNLISKQTVGADGASSVTFSNIPQTYTDLVIKVSARQVATSDFPALNMTINGTSSGYSSRYLLGSGSAASSGTGGSTTTYLGSVDGSSQTANTFNSAEITIPNYTSSNYKSISSDTVAENNATAGYDTIVANLWSNTAAVTSLTFTGSTNFAQYSTFYLYGVSNSSTQNASVPYASGGDVITTDGTYWYHTFLYSGTFTPLKALSCDYLVVAGGGAGGNYYGAGGGAGGLRSTVTATGGGGSLESKLSLGTSAYTVTIGAGGAAATTNGARGGSGSDSVFATITSTGGGGGGGAATKDGLNGGSGGGSEETGTAGTGTTNQGYAGGAGQTASPYRGGGGGGAGAAGATGATSGNGGAGVATSISGSSVTYAGGGGGGVAIGGTAGTGGSGGGGNGSVRNSGSPTSGTVNTGGGGGSNGTDGAVTSGAGGSGIVVVRYLV